MDSKTSKYLQQAGKYVTLGKLTLALEQYLKIHELQPEDTTILNTIGDLYVRLDDKENGRVWYTKLADAFVYRQLLSNAMATYRKILKLFPKDQEAILQLAHLSERVGQKNDAKNFYRMLAKQKMDLGNHEEAISLFQRVCRLEPGCSQSLLELAQNLELVGKQTEAVRSYLECANLFADQDKMDAAMMVTESIFRLRPQDKEIVKSFFRLLQKLNLTSKGIEYLNSLGIAEEPEFKLVVTDLLLQEGELEAAKKILKESVKKSVAFYEPSIKLLRVLIGKRDLEAATDLLETIFDISLQLHDESTMVEILDDLAELDADNVRILKTLTIIMIRMNDKLKLEKFLKKLVTLQLRKGDLRDARESLNKLVVHGQQDFYLDLLNLLNEATTDPDSETMKTLTDRIVRSFEQGRLDKNDTASHSTMALGVSELDLGIGLMTGVEEEFVLDHID